MNKPILRKSDFHTARFTAVSRSSTRDSQRIVLLLFYLFFIVSLICLMVAWSAQLLAASNLDVPINLNTAEYRTLAETRKTSGQETAALENGLTQINQLWEQLGNATERSERIRIIADLTEQLGGMREQARGYQQRQDDIRLQALKTLDKSGVRAGAEVSAEDYTAFKDVAAHFGDDVFAKLDRQTRTATSNLIAVNRMVIGMTKVRREMATSNLIGISSARDLLRITQNAELSMLAGRSIERLMDTMLGGLQDLVVEEQEGELSNQQIHTQRQTLQDATAFAVHALERPGGVEKTAADNSPMSNPFRE